MTLLRRSAVLACALAGSLAHAENGSAGHSSADWWVAGATIALALITLVLAVYTARLWRSTKEAGERQSNEMKDSIAQAIRSADAMEAVAEATRANAALMQATLHRQMRAYVTVDLGQAFHQDERLRFEGKPALENTGFTPARNVSYRFMADVLPANLAANYNFPEPPEEIRNDASLAPRQKLLASGGIVQRRFSDAEVEEIMAGEGRKLYVWGTVSYNDIFGEQRWQTDFCVSITFFQVEDGGYRSHYHYHPTHNGMT
jgi:hypothetical protein